MGALTDVKEHCAEGIDASKRALDNAYLRRSYGKGFEDGRIEAFETILHILKGLNEGEEK